MKKEVKYGIIVALSIMAICLAVTSALADDNLDAVGGSDLIVTDISPNCGYLFGNESNEICVTVENIGFADAGAFDVGFSTDGFREEVRVDGGLTAGANTTVCVTDPTLRNAGYLVNIKVIADSKREVAESNETNNWMTTSETVVNNGYKGKRYTGGDDITMWKTYVLHGNLLYSVGDSRYLSGSATAWTTYTANWTASDLPVSATAPIEEARLYVIYNWDKVQGMPENVSLSFNGILKPRDAFYTDRKGYGGSDYPYGMLAYNVTGDFNTSGNTAILTNLNPVAGNPSIRGMLLMVIYEDAGEAKRKIVVNEGFDLLYGGSAQCTTPEEATAYAPFGAIDTSYIETATLITVAPGAGPKEGELIFNRHTWYDVWNFGGSSQIGINETEVTSYLNATGNEAGFQSSGDYMEASNAILIIEYEPEPTVAISTDKLKYCPGDEMEVTLDITNPTSKPVTFEWYIGVPQFDIWIPLASTPIPAAFDETYTIPISVGDWGPKPFGIVHYVHMLDPVSGDVLDQDEHSVYYSPGAGMGKAMPVDIEEEIKRTIGKVELVS